MSDVVHEDEDFIEEYNIKLVANKWHRGKIYHRITSPFQDQSSKLYFHGHIMALDTGIVQYTWVDIIHTF